MNFRAITTLAAAGALVVTGATVRADDQAEIKAAFVKLSKAFQTKNSKAIFDMSTAAFTEKNHGMVIDAKTSKAQMDQVFAMAKTVKECSFTPKKIEVHGNTATVMSDGKAEFVIEDKMGQMGPKGATHTMSDRSMSKVTMVKEKGKWLFKQLEMVNEKPMLDGKPMNMGGGAPPSPKKK